MTEALQYPFFQRALLSGILASVACGVVGTYVVVRRMASISGGLSHAAFGGVGLGYLLGFPPLLGATGFALLGGMGLAFFYRRLRSSLDTLISMVWAVGMALGVLFVAMAPGYAPDLMSYLFGSILFVPDYYLRFVFGLDVLILVTVFVLFKEFQAVAFDEEHSQVMGVPTRGIQVIMLGLVSLAVVTLIQVVGVILVIALLTVPAATARHWTESIRGMMVLASLLGAVCTVSGLFLSYGLAESVDIHVPTGPVIILIAATLYGVSSLLSSIFRSQD